MGVVKSSMANKAARIEKILGLGAYEPNLTSRSIRERHPLAWLVEVNGFVVDARVVVQLAEEGRDGGR